MNRLLLIFAVALVLASCTFHHARVQTPKRIAILPVINEVIDIDPPKIVYPMLYREFASREYYIVPPLVVHELLREEKNITEGGMLTHLAAEEIGKLLHADALLYVTITDWSTKYILISSTVTVTLKFKLVESATGRILFETEQTAQKSSGQKDEGLLAKMVGAVAHAILQSYTPLAEEAVDKASQLLPYGPFVLGKNGVYNLEGIELVEENN